MESFIEQNDILSPSQYGFRKAHSTQRVLFVKWKGFSFGKRFVSIRKHFQPTRHSPGALYFLSLAQIDFRPSESTTGATVEVLDKCCKPSILAEIINISMSSGMYPTKLKRQKLFLFLKLKITLMQTITGLFLCCLTVAGSSKNWSTPEWNLFFF